MKATKEMLTKPTNSHSAFAQRIVSHHFALKTSYGSDFRSFLSLIAFSARFVCLREFRRCRWRKVATDPEYSISIKKIGGKRKKKHTLLRHGDSLSFPKIDVPSDLLAQSPGNSIWSSPLFQKHAVAMRGGSSWQQNSCLYADGEWHSWSR